MMLSCTSANVLKQATCQPVNALLPTTFHERVLYFWYLCLYQKEKNDVKVNFEPPLYMFVCFNQNTGQNYNNKIAHKFLRNVAKFKHSGNTFSSEYFVCPSDF
jgi:hypothetical protein